MSFFTASRRLLRLLTLTAVLAGLAAVQLLAQNTNPRKQETRPGPVDQFEYIIGGEPVDDFNEFPWMVSIVDKVVLGFPGNDVNSSSFCGGTLIRPNWVLTASHCFFLDFQNGITIPAGDLAVFVGGTDLSADEPRLIDVTERILHPDFVIAPENLRNDIALLRLAEAVEFPNVHLATGTNTAVDAAGAEALILGWGARQFDPEMRVASDFPSMLHRADTEVVDVDDCADAYMGISPPAEILPEQHVCAGFLGMGGVDTCDGDSGGPLLISDGEGGLLQIGITSFGVDCADPDFPGVYTNVGNFDSWITQQLSPRTEAGVGDSAPLQNFVIAVDTRSPFNTGLAITNMTDSMVDLTFTLYNTGGEMADQTQDTLAASGQRATFLAGAGGLFPDQTNFTGSLQVTASGDVAAVTLRQNGLAGVPLTTLPVIPGDTAQTSFVLPQVADAAGIIESELIAVNPGDVGGQVTFNFVGQDGTPVELTLSNGETGSSVTIDVPAHGSVFLRTDGDNNLRVVSARITSTVPVGVTAIIALP
ncbi:MAG TPA: trypsin-like serine protease [Acidobacteriota bacterium]|nr:trypsin-like serine protease [Acidobacteriota bacterium]